jgi:hypothetical protein
MVVAGLVRELIFLLCGTKDQTEGLPHSDTELYSLHLERLNFILKLSKVLLEFSTYHNGKKLLLHLHWEFLF